jgi:hypothetical protein
LVASFQYDARAVVPQREQSRLVVLNAAKVADIC